jgi:hypothetical protein
MPRLSSHYRFLFTIWPHVCAGRGTRHCVRGCPELLGGVKEQALCSCATPVSADVHRCRKPNIVSGLGTCYGSEYIGPRELNWILRDVRSVFQAALSCRLQQAVNGGMQTSIGCADIFIKCAHCPQTHHCLCFLMMQASR